MHAHEIDRFIPEPYRQSQWSSLPLGIENDSDALYFWDQKSHPHAGFFGAPSSLATVAMNRAALSALARGHRVLVIDHSGGGVEYGVFGNSIAAIARTPHEAARALTRLVKKMEHRRATLEHHRVKGWRSLSPEAREAEGIDPFTVLVHNFDDLVKSKGSDIREDYPGGNSLYFAKRLVQGGAAVGIHVALGAGLESMDDELLSELAALTFPSAGSAEGSTSNAGRVHFQVAPLWSADVPEILSLLEVPDERQWDLTR